MSESTLHKSERDRLWLFFKPGEQASPESIADCFDRVWRNLEPLSEPLAPMKLGRRKTDEEPPRRERPSDDRQRIWLEALKKIDRDRALFLPQEPTRTSPSKRRPRTFRGALTPYPEGLLRLILEQVNQRNDRGDTGLSTLSRDGDHEPVPLLSCSAQVLAE